MLSQNVSLSLKIKQRRRQKNDKQELRDFERIGKRCNERV